MTLDNKSKNWFEKYLRYVDYIAVGELYLKDNFLLKRPLALDDIKDRILGHWGTVPGQNFIYAHCNYLISKHEDLSMMLVVGPGHGAPGPLADLFAEGTLGEIYPDYKLGAKGMGRLMKDFSWPGKFPSHLTPIVPGTILEGGELGYSLATAYGAVLDNPELIVACIIGDGEAETGPLSAAWHSNKFLNPTESGAVLPILHVNGYKISGPTIYGTMKNSELEQLFSGFGYEPRIVDGANLHAKMADAMEWAHSSILKIQKRARTGKKAVIMPKWPVIVLRTEKGMSGPEELEGKKIEGNFRSHGIPLKAPKKDKKQFKLLKEWLESYKIEELVDSKGMPLPEVLEFVPRGKQRMGMNKHTYGGDIRKKLKMPRLEKYEVKFKKRGYADFSNAAVGAEFIRDIFVENKAERNFRFMCPDETDSNKMGALFEVTGRAYEWPLKSYDEWMARDGRVMEILSEHTLQGWLQGYLLTGRHGIFATYEAFATIVTSMVDQHAKFLKQSKQIPWRKPVASLNYILTSLGWRQEHNGYSHQNPGFVSSILEKHGAFSSVYLPADANSYLVALEDSLKRTNAINIFVVGKQEMPQWLTLDEARKQHKLGVGIWDWAHPGSEHPDVVMAAAGDNMVFESMAAISILKKIIPELAVRFVNISELTALGIGDERHPLSLSNNQFDKYFTKDRPVVFNFHGYTGVIKRLTWGHPACERFSIHGYDEEGTTTTPFDMHVRNRTSRFHLVMDAVQRGAEFNDEVAVKAPKIVKMMERKLTEHQRYIRKYGKDMEEIDAWKWA